jgi:type II secretory pathway component PulC
MRLVTGLLALTLTGSLAYADEAKAPEPQPAQVATARSKVSLRVVKLMPESHQALLFDKIRGTHVLADVGSVIGTYTVMEIGEDEVILSSAGRELVLPAPEPAPAPRSPARTAAPADPYDLLAPPVPGGPDDPYAPDVDAAPSSVPMVNPYDEAALDAALKAGAGNARVAAAPDAVTITEMEVDPYAEPAPVAAPTTIEADPYAEPAPAPAVKPAARPLAKDPAVEAFVEANGQVIVKTQDQEPVAAPAPKPAKAREPATTLSRTEVNTALGDFGLLTASVRGAFTPEGARIDTVAQGSVFAKAGLKNGDLITAVDGKPLKSIDDAADLYIRAGSARTAKVALLRDGKPMTLRLAIQ